MGARAMVLVFDPQGKQLVGFVDILPCLKAEDSCYWFSDRTY